MTTSAMTTRRHCEEQSDVATQMPLTNNAVNCAL
jgi:hypothetical protein